MSSAHLDSPSEKSEIFPLAPFDAFWKRFGEFLKAFRTPILVYLIISTALLTVILGITEWRPDYLTYYWASKLFFQDPNLIYDADLLYLTYNLFAYRYFPALCILMYPLTLFPPTVSFLIFTAGSYFFSIFNIFLVYDTVRVVNNDKIKPTLNKLCKIYFFLPFVYSTLLTGQNSNYVAFFLIFSLYNYLKKREVAGSLLLGFSLVIKPASFFQIFFVALGIFRIKSLKPFLKRVLFIAIPLLPDILLFLFVPNLLQGFIQVDFGEFARTGTIPVFMMSVSFSNSLIVLGNASSTIVMVSLIVLFCITGIVLMSKITNPQTRILFSFVYGAVIYFVIQSDVWETQYAYLYLFLILIGSLATFRKEKVFVTLLILYDVINVVPPLLWVTIDPSRGWSLHVYYAACGIIILIFTIFVVQYFLRQRMNSPDNAPSISL